MKNMKKRYFIAWLIALALLSGCGKKEKQSVEDDFRQITETATGSDAAAFDTSSVPSKLEYTLEGTEGGEIKVDADVIQDGCNGVYVYTVDEAVFDEEYVDKLAKRVFDEEVYTLELPYSVMSEEQLLSEGEAAMIENQSEEQEFVYTYRLAQILEHRSNFANLGEVCEKEQGKMFYPSQTESYEDPTATEMQTKDINCALLGGKIDGRAFELSVIRDDDGDDDFVWLYTKDDGIRFVDYYVEYDEEVGNIYGENSCDYKQAKDISEEMINILMDGEDYRICQIFERMETADNGVDIVPVGYRFVYLPCINEVIPSFNTGDVACNEDGSMTKQPYVCIDVDDRGFISARYAVSLKLNSVLTSDANMLTFDKIDAQMKNYFQELLDFGQPRFAINRVQFSYVLTGTKDGCAFVPCWIYYLDQTGNVWSAEEGIAGINALDGSLIRFVATKKTFLVLDDVFY